jgi:hypothetical protein
VLGNRQVAPTTGKGTAVSNIYQGKAADTSPTPAAPTDVLISLGEIAESAKDVLRALAVGAGTQVMYAMMDAEWRRWSSRRTSRCPTEPQCVTDTGTARSPWAGVGYRYADRGSAPPTLAVR